MIIGWLKEFCCAVGMILGAVIGVMAFVFIFQVAPVVTEEIQDLSVIRSVSDAIYEVRAYFYYRNLYARINDPELRRIKPIILEKGIIERHIDGPYVPTTRSA